MEQLFIFTALIQTILIAIVLGKRASLKDLSALLLFLLTVHYTFVVFVGFWNSHSAYQLTRLHIPTGFAAGPLYFYFVRFSFLPTKDVSKRWFWWFAPVVLEVFNAVVYWLLVAFNSDFAESFKGYANDYSRLGFIYFAAFFVAAIAFLIRHKTLISMNIMYKEQLKWIKVLMLFIALFILDELFSSDTQMLFSGLISCGFTSTFLYSLVSGNQNLQADNSQNKELLKEALNEQKKAVVIANKEEIMEYVNEPFLNIIGYRHRDVIGRKLTFLRGNLTTPESIKFMREKLDEQVNFEVDIVNYRKNGEAYMCHIMMIPVFNDNKLSHFIAYKEDVRTILEATPQNDELQLFEAIKTYFTDKEPFKNKQLQVADIAEHFDISSRRLGEILKKCSNQSFSEFVNAYRVQAVIDLMQNNENQQLTIEAISQICGFNSKSVFNAAFKKEMGKTPSNYLESTTING
jgi:PAS domain S-box-containing protein